MHVLASGVAARIRDGFDDYNARFAAITRRARPRFEARDWSGMRADLVERIELYDVSVAQTQAWLDAALGERAQERALWQAIRDAFAAQIAPLLDQELYKTYFNTLTRRFFRTRGVDPAIEFVALDIEPTDRITHPVARHNYAVHGDLAAVFERVLAGYAFDVPYAHAARCAGAMAACIAARFATWGERPLVALELLETVFFREHRAFLVGRALGETQHTPFTIALAHGPDGLVVDAVLTDRDHLAQVFGFTRSYFFADLPTVGDAVVFLRALLPKKPVDELYTVLGRAKQGKTERYRNFFHHLQQHPDERFRHADGERGMVMLVFTLPSYPLVFKLIRDRFAWPKEMAREEVVEKYRIVSRHDRAGRLVDAQEFRYLRFARRQFEAPLLAELLDGCRLSVYEDGDDIVVSHCYVERRLRPLNLYLREVAPDDALRAVVDYGQAIKDLARSDIFPGDLLLKNFGITRNRRAIFYDYDELCLVRDCRFRRLPQATTDDEEMHHGAWYHVDERDVFPEQFPRFLGLTPAQQEALLAAHGEIFDVRWWIDLQRGLADSQHTDVPPYPESARIGGTPAPPRGSNLPATVAV
ncbi:bifunctional isocitrate dehydrogenase kinase/phosphatase [Chiayiivirga flava]|uniref:Isocitrate dehydrogenase kinase/phosphatase n=1 Tax=Chiayiivirga flava TaxID=659595 RepID=A0A7W8D6K6_9GAMM|nr:bifunctional isocitrate dehydrogenase kinase/phosphatase [Chiayiivirga flava]MBB5207735.1 isocitrate dehydrogenase kinase/phosphatase [Chiayiivirga flava]